MRLAGSIAVAAALLAAGCGGGDAGGGEAASGKARRTCEVPGDVPLFFPVLNQMCPAEQAPECGRAFREAEIDLTIDGTAGDIEYVESPAFKIEGDPAEYVAAGHHALVQPLEPGEHEIAFSGRRQDGFALDVRYRLTVR